MQKRGVFVDAEDFLPVTKTYPDHPLSKVVPSSKHVADMKEKRKSTLKAEVDRYNKKDAEYKGGLQQAPTYVKSEFLISDPTHTSIKQRVEEDLQAARRKAGLTDTVQDIKDEVV